MELQELPNPEIVRFETIISKIPFLNDIYYITFRIRGVSDFTCFADFFYMLTF